MKVFGLAIFLVGLLCESIAYAGARWPTSVYVSPNSGSYRYAYGTVGAARHSNDSTQYIECETTSGSAGWCVASDSSGNVLVCSSSDPVTLATMRTVNSTSFIDFSVPAGSGTCLGFP